MVKKYKVNPSEVEVVFFEDTAECLTLLSEWTNQEISVNYEDPNNPILNIKIKGNKNGLVGVSVREGYPIIKYSDTEFAAPWKIEDFYNSFIKI